LGNVALLPLTKNTREGLFDRGADRERVSGIVLARVIRAEIATEHCPGLADIGCIGGGGPVILKRHKVVENRCLEQSVVAIEVGVTEKVRMIVFHPVGQALHLASAGHPPIASPGVVGQSALATG
jgi:hypothetical protein